MPDTSQCSLHWPEWTCFDDLARHHEAINRLRDADLAVVWTAHNLTPHDQDPDLFQPIYQAWCDGTDAIIHHSAWGRHRFNQRYVVPDRVSQVVIPHGHFGDLYPQAHPEFRRVSEEALGLRPAGPGTGLIRIGIVGAPRAEKDLATFFAGLAASQRNDIEVVCWSLRPDEVRPEDPRVVSPTLMRWSMPISAVATAAVSRQQSSYDWGSVSARTKALFDSVLALPG